MRLSRVAVLAISLFMLLAATAFAQNNSLRADIPFPFYVGSTLLPAGQYTVSVDSAFHRLEVRAAESVDGAILHSRIDYRAKPAEQSVVTFHRYGDSYFLRSMVAAGRGDAYELDKTRAEREMAKTGQRLEVAQVRLTQ